MGKRVSAKFNILNTSPTNPWPVFLLSATALLILAFFSVGYYHPDEHFQILEFARWKLDPTRSEPLPWEFFQQMRPAIQPAIVVSVHKVFAFFGNSDPFLITFFLRVLSAGLSFLAFWMMFQRYKREIISEILQKWFLLLSFLLWFSLYNAVRFSSETWSGAIFIIGFSYLFVTRQPPAYFDFFITGIILGLSFIFRYQTGFLIAGFLLWLVVFRLIISKETSHSPTIKPRVKQKILQLTILVSGIVVVIIAGVVVDRWFYGKWVLTAWNYFEQNILADKISGFGIQPWWFYFEDVFIRALPPFSLVFILGSLIVFIFRRNDILTWTLVPFIMIHFIIGHKEVRFFYPLIGFLPILVIKGIETAKEKWFPTILQKRFTLIFSKIFWIVNCIFIFVVFFIPADSQIGLYQKIYDRYPYPITLYYISDDPYHRALDISYYKRGSLSIKKAVMSSLPDSIPDKKYLIALRKDDFGIERLKNRKQIYSTYPEWIKYFNFNNWLSRTQVWYIYEGSE